MRFFFVLSYACMLCTTLTAQDFSGYRTSNRMGVNGVFFNPANIADSHYRWDANLFSFSTQIGNDQASFSLKNLKHSFNGDSLGNQLFGSQAGPANGFVSMDFHGPSVMFQAGGKMTVALTTRARIMANAADVDGKLISKITNDFSNDPQLPYSISTDRNMRVTVNGWSEFGASVARVLMDKGPHVLKAGVTFKYLAGAANAYMNVGGFRGTLNADYVAQDAFLSSTSGRIAAGFGGVRISDFDAKQLTKMESRGFGGDIGLVYEFRPGFAGSREENNDQDANGYKLRVAVSLLDLGKIRYKKDLQRSGAYTIDITGNERLYLNSLDGLGVDDYKAFFNSRPQLFTPVTGNDQQAYSVALPSSLNMEIDYHVSMGWYVHLGSLVSLMNAGSKLFNSNYYNGITLTPRYEGRRFGAYVPLNYNQLTKFNAGLSLRFGPVFIGSGSVLRALAGHSRQADLHAGVRFGMMSKKNKG